MRIKCKEKVYGNKGQKLTTKNLLYPRVILQKTLLKTDASELPLHSAQLLFLLSQSKSKKQNKNKANPADLILFKSFNLLFTFFHFKLSILTIFHNPYELGDCVLLYQQDTKLTLSESLHVSDITHLTLKSHMKINNQRQCTLIDQSLLSQEQPKQHVLLGPLPWSKIKLRSYYVFKCFGKHQSPELEDPFFSDGQIVFTHWASKTLH